MKRGGNA